MVQSPQNVVTYYMNSPFDMIQSEDLLFPRFLGVLFSIPQWQEVKVDSGSEHELSWVQSAFSWIQLKVSGVI